MAVPNPKIPAAGDSLLSYLRVQERYDRRMYALLRRAASDVQQQILSLVGRENVGSVIRVEQLVAVQRAIHEQIAALLRSAGLTVAAGREEAAAAALGVFVKYDAVLMKAVGDRKLVDAYLASAKSTSAVGIELASQRLLGASYIPLSTQVYRTTALATGLVDKYVESALTRGLTARELAAGVRGMIMPNVRGGVSYASMRLARTEINNAAHAVSAARGRATPWVTGMLWNLSGSHPQDDDCDVLAGTAHYPNLPEGFFKPEDVPQKPHPLCLCFITPETVGDDSFMQSFLAGEYDSFINSVAQRDGFSFAE